jgi:apolipoprotein N-acyltransferase
MPTYYNSILALDSDGVIFDAADKKHLVPFGEYLPLRPLLERIGLKAIAAAADRGYSPAERRRALSLPRRRRCPALGLLRSHLPL